MNDKERAMSKIQKCLRLSKSTNPHEAAQAVKQAYALMKKHNISEQVVNGCEYLIKGSKVQSHKTQQVPCYLDTLLSVICRTFTVEVIFNESWNKTCVTFYGEQSDVMIAEYAYTFLSRQLIKSRVKYISLLSRRLSRSEKTKRGDIFAEGWVLGVHEELKTLQRHHDGEYEAACSKVKEYKKSLTGELKIAKTKDTPEISSKESAAYYSGYEAGSNVSINRAVNNTEHKCITQQS